jgi:cytochrome c-type biogenesis protein
MSGMMKASIVVALVIVVGLVLAIKQGQKADAGKTDTAAEVQGQAAETQPAGKKLPKMIDLGAGKCIPCKAMKPILDDLKANYADHFQTIFIDVWEDNAKGREYGIRSIPTQIFYDAEGKELFRHEGFYGKEDILAKWKEFGVDAGHGGQVTGAFFTQLSRAVEGTWAVALAASFVWGVLSIILSPCHLASIPLIVGFIDEQGRISTKRAFAISTLFATGILVTIAATGVVAALLGRIMGDIGGWVNYVVAIVFFAVGLHLLGMIPMPWSGPAQVGMKRRGALAAFILGLVFGIALGPCTFAYMAPMLAVTFRLASTNLAYGILLLLAYGVGHCSVIVLAGTFTEVVQRYMNWTEKSKGAVILKKICGVLVLLGGLYLIYTTR